MTTEPLSLLDRAAAELLRLYYEGHGFPPIAWEDADPGSQERVRNEVRAVAAVLFTEPASKAMLSAGGFYFIQGAGPMGNIEAGLARDTYRAMSRARLRELGIET